MMPQKRNPDVFEIVRGKASAQLGDLVALLATTKGLPSGYNRDLQEDREPLLATGARARAVLSVLGVALPRVSFDPARCAAAIDEDATQATDLAEALVLKGVAFRTAYRVVGALVQLCREEKTALGEVTLEQAKRVDARFDEEALAAARPRGSVQRKVSAGGTGPESIRAQIEALRAIVESARSFARALPRLDELFASLAEGA
jgi:argininosuccinate lyase